MDPGTIVPALWGQVHHPDGYLNQKKLPGRMGNERVTVANLEVVKVDAERKPAFDKGRTARQQGTLLTIKETVKN